MPYCTLPTLTVKFVVFENKKERISKTSMVRRILVDSDRTRVFRRIFDMPSLFNVKKGHTLLNKKISVTEGSSCSHLFLAQKLNKK